MSKRDVPQAARAGLAFFGKRMHRRPRWIGAEAPHLPVRLMLHLAVALAGLFLAPTPGRAAEAVHAAYVLYAESPSAGTVLLARVIVDGKAACPALQVGGKTVTMTPRRNPSPRSFPVTVCEALYPFGQAGTIAGTPVALPMVTKQPSHVVLFGDTGCKGLKKNGKGQDCADPAAWPFGAFAKSAAGEKPDLVIHVGDYNYIGTPSDIPFSRGKSPRSVFDAGDHAPPGARCREPQPYTSQNAADSLLPDHWGHWRQDFFEPARPLLAAAPWVFARGNHELCSRAGPGWFYFLSPRSSLLGSGAEEMHCPSGPGQSPTINGPPYRLDVGPIDLVVMDTTLACDAAESPEFTEMYASQFEKLPAVVRNKPTWLVTHRPIWAVIKAAKRYRKADRIPAKAVVDSNRTLQIALRLGNGGALPPSVGLVLAGHVHRFQSVTFASGRPPVLIVGDGGTKLDSDRPTGPFIAPVDGAEARIVSENVFGYLTATLAQDGSWTGTWHGTVAHSKKGSVTAACGTTQQRKGSLCVLGAP